MLILVVNFCFSVKQNSDQVLSINLVPRLLSGREKWLMTLQYLPNGNAFYFIRKYCIYFNYRFKDDAKNLRRLMSIHFFWKKKNSVLSLMLPTLDPGRIIYVH